MTKEKVNLLQVIKSVLYALIGVQKKSNAQKDFIQPSPWAYVIVGIIAVVIFIGILASVVKYVTMVH